MQIETIQKNQVDQLRHLLKYFNLVTEDIDLNKQLFVGVTDNSGLTAIGGIELYPPYALLRSIAVTTDHQDKGLARQICEALFAKALSNHCPEIYLLTETAEDYFIKLGFKPVTRDTVPQRIKSSPQYNAYCPDDATVMHKSLTLSAG